MDLGRVRIHTGGAAARSARHAGARAYTVGSHIVFGAGRYQPDTEAGVRLLAHELTHVVQQQRGGRGAASRRTFSDPGDAAEREAEQVAEAFASGHDSAVREVPEAAVHRAAGVTSGQEHSTWDPEDLQIEVTEPLSAEIQREVEGAGAPTGDPAPVAGAESSSGDSPLGAPTPGDAPVAPVGSQAGTAAAPSAPTLDVTPGTTVVRGDTVTANFRTPAAPPASPPAPAPPTTTYNVTGWEFVTSSDTVTRNARETTFQTSWVGKMALSGTLRLTYVATPPGGAAQPPVTLTAQITVNDRTGAPWQSASTLDAEVPFTGSPSPPVRFRDLGRHAANVQRPQPTAVTIAAGPNQGLRFAEALTSGTYRSSPKIHADLTDSSKQFFTFHQTATRLYWVPTSGARALIPLADYSNLVLDPFAFTATNREQLYKARRVMTVTATSGSTTVTCQDAWWGLSSNAADASLVVRDDAAIRQALGITTAAYTLNGTSNGSWSGFQLQPIASIHTGTQSHEYVHATHSHRANFQKMVRALEPDKRIENRVGTPSAAVDHAALVQTWVSEILRPDHEIVDEAASRTREAFVAQSGTTMAGVNQDPATGTFLGSVWNIPADREMS